MKKINIVFSLILACCLNTMVNGSENKITNFKDEDYQAAVKNIKKALDSIYKKRKVKTISSKVHQAILDGSDLGSLENVLCPEKHPTIGGRCINKKDLRKKLTRYSITAMHLAVLMEDLKAIEWLFNRDASLLNIPDKNGWTPAHFTSLHNTDGVLKYLQAKGSSLAKKNLQNITAHSLWTRSHLTKTSEQRIHFWDKNTSSVLEIDGDEFYARTGSHFVEHVKINPSILAKSWLLKFEQDYDFSSYPVPLAFKDSVENYAKEDLQSFSDLYIKKKTGSHSKNIGYGVFAKRAFKVGEVIGDYQGEWIGLQEVERRQSDPQYDKTSEYCTVNIDASKLRGYMAFANDGAPNIHFFPMANSDGFSVSEIFIVIKNIEMNEEILFDYGLAYPLKGDLENYKEISPNSVDELLKEKSLLDQIKATDDRNIFSFAYYDGDGSDHDFLYRISMLKYIFHTSPVFLRLFKNGKITVEDIREMKRLRNPGMQFAFRNLYEQRFLNFMDFVLERSANEGVD